MLETYTFYHQFLYVPLAMVMHLKWPFL